MTISSFLFKYIAVSVSILILAIIMNIVKQQTDNTHLDLGYDILCKILGWLVLPFHIIFIKLPQFIYYNIILNIPNFLDAVDLLYQIMTNIVRIILTKLMSIMIMPSI